MADVPANRSLRIGFAERDAAMKELGDHYAAGRLELAEFEERADLANVARTQADLDALFTDLPRPHDQSRRRSRERAPRAPRPYSPHPLQLLAAAAVPLAVFALVLAIVVGRPGPWIFFLLLWLWFGFGLGHRRRHWRQWSSHSRG